MSIVKVDNCEFDVLAVAGDTHLGGEDFDNRIMEYCIEEFQKTTGIDLTNNTKALRRLRPKIEEAKRILSSAPSAEIIQECIAQDFDL